MSKSKPESPSKNPDDKSTVSKAVEECPRGELLVTVKDSAGKPVEGVTVTSGSWGMKLTDKDGNADYGKVPAGTNDITATKVGHAPSKGEEEGKDEKCAVSVEDGVCIAVSLVQHPICANVSFFEGATSRAKYFGFDHKTNLVATPDTDEYWLPTPAKGSLSAPTNNQTRDGTRWVSVAEGKEVELEIHFAFTGDECIPCIKNSIYEIVPATTAEVITTSITSKKAVFKIKGKAEGEATLKVKCDGKDIGWFHIWCTKSATLKVDVINIVTDRAPSNSYSLSGLKSAFEDIYQQAAIKIDMIDLGDLDLSANTALKTIEDTGYPATGKFLAKTGSPKPYNSKSTILNAINVAASTALGARTTAPLARVGAYRIYRYIPTVGAAIGGTVLGIGSSPAFAFIQDGAAARNSMAHEFGHCLGLKHPSDSSSSSQYASHNRATLNQAVPAYDATNTEPATTAANAKSNVMSTDPTNLMGYWSDKANRKRLRYHQWVACNRS